MNKTVPLFSVYAVYLTEVVAYCNLFMFFVSTPTYNYGRIELWAWLGLVTAVFYGLHWYLQGQRSVTAVTVVTVLWVVAGIGVMSLGFIHVGSWSVWLAAWIIVAISIVRAPFYLLKDCSTYTVLLGCELPVVGICFLLWMHSAQVYYLPTYYIVCTFGVLAMNLLGLAMARMYSVTGAVKDKGPMVTTIGLCLGVIGGFCYGFVHLASGFATTAVEKTTAFVTWLYVTITSIIWAFFVWIDSLFPVPQYESTSTGYTELEVAESDLPEAAELNKTALMVVVTLLILAGVGLLLHMFWTVRKRKLTTKGLKNRYQRPTQKVDRLAFWRHLKQMLKKAWQHLVYQVKIFTRRNTPQGAVIVLGKIGRTRGVGRSAGESYGAYLLRLADLCTPFDPSAGQSLRKLASILDNTLYGGGVQNQSLSVREYENMRYAVAKIEKKSGILKNLAW